MKTKSLLSRFAFVAGMMFAAGLFAQTPKVEFPAPSPGSTLKQRVGLTDIEISYSRPGAKGRPIFGGLVPYGEVWRTGANARTKVSFSTAVKLGGQDIPAGTYALFTIPGETQWTIILNTDTKSSALDYKTNNEVARFTAPVVKLGEHVETFTILVNNIRDDSATIDLIWDYTCVPIRLDLDLVGQLAPQIDAAMSAPGEKKPYYQAAMFYFDHGLDLQKAKTWIDAAVQADATYYVVHLQAKILAKLGDKEGAIAAAKRSSELARKAEGAGGYIKLNDDLISSLN